MREPVFQYQGRVESPFPFGDTGVLFADWFQSTQQPLFRVPPRAVCAVAATMAMPPPASIFGLHVDSLPESLCVRCEYVRLAGEVCSGFLEVYVNGRWWDATVMYECFGSDFPRVEGRILGLQPNTEYTFRATFRRYNVSGQSNWVVTHNGLLDSGFSVLEERVVETTATTAVDQPTFGTPRTAVYIRTDGGSDSNGGTGPNDAWLTLNKLKTYIQANPGTAYDMYYVGKCDFTLGSSNQVEFVDGEETNWNSFRPYEPTDAEDPSLAGEIIGYREITDTWTLVEEGIYKVSMSDPVGRVAYYDSTLAQWRLLQGCRVYDVADQDPESDTVATLAIKTGAKLSGDVENIEYGADVSGKFTITSTGHGLAVGQWVAIWGVKGSPEQTWTSELEQGLLLVLAVPSANEFVVDAGVAGNYTGGGHWESQRMAGFFWKRSTEELYVRLPDESQPTSGQIRAGYKSSLIVFGRTAPTPNGPQYIYFDLRCNLAGTNSGTGDDVLYSSPSNNGNVDINGARNCIITGDFKFSGLNSGAADPNGWKDCLVDNASFTSDGPYDYIIGRAKANTPRMWSTMDDAVHFNLAYQQYRHDGSLWPRAIYVRNADRVAFRNLTIRGEGFHIGEIAGTLRDVRHTDIYRCSVNDVYDLFSLTDNLCISVACYHNVIDNGYYLGSPSPIYAGPLWYIGNYINETFLKFSKQGDGDSTKGHAFVIYANNSAYSDRDTATEEEGVVAWHGGTFSGAIAVNNAFSYTTCLHRPVIFAKSPGAASVAQGRINYFRNNYYYIRNVGPVEATADSVDIQWGTTTTGDYTNTHTRGTSYPGDMHIVTRTNNGSEATVDVRYLFNVDDGVNPIVPATHVIWKGRMSSAAPMTGIGQVQSMVRNWSVENESDPGAWDRLYFDYNGGTLLGLENGHALEPEHTSDDGDVIIRFYGYRSDTSSWGVLTDFIAVNHGLLSWAGTYYADFDAMHSALSSDTAQFIDQVVLYDELIDEGSGFAGDGYIDDGIYVRGVTNIASRGAVPTGYNPVGWFSRFSYDDVALPKFYGDSPVLLSRNHAAMVPHFDASNLLRVPLVSEFHDVISEPIFIRQPIAYFVQPSDDALLLQIPTLDQWHDAIAEPIVAPYMPLHAGEQRTEIVAQSPAPDLTGASPTDPLPPLAVTATGEHVTSYDYSSPAPAPDLSGLYASDIAVAANAMPTVGADTPLDFSQPVAPDIVTVVTSAVMSPPQPSVSQAFSSGSVLSATVPHTTASQVFGLQHVMSPLAVLGFATDNVSAETAVATSVFSVALMAATETFAAPLVVDAILPSLIASPLTAVFSPVAPSLQPGPLEPSLFTEPLLVDWWRPLDEPVRRIPYAQPTEGDLGVEPSVLVEPVDTPSSPGSVVVTVVGPASTSAGRVGLGGASVIRVGPASADATKH